MKVDWFVCEQQREQHEVLISNGTNDKQIFSDGNTTIYYYYIGSDSRLSTNICIKHLKQLL